MSDERTIHIPNLFSQKGKIYCFTDDALIIKTDRYQNTQTIIPREKIVSLRFGVKWIRGLYFPIGRHFNIELQLDNGTVIPLRFSSYYGIKKDLYNERYSELINTVWEYLFYPDLLDIAHRFKNGETLHINGVEFNKSGLCWDKQELLTWDKIKLVKYKTYFALRHADDAMLNKCFYFLSDWDALMLQQAIQMIMDRRAKYADQKFEVNLN